MDELIQVPGTQFVVLANDANLTPEAMKQGTIVLERQIAELPCVQELRSDDVVLDVGAFIGDTALIFGEHVARVLAFEPQTDAFRCLCINSKNSINFNLAVGDGTKVVCGTDMLGGNAGTRRVIADSSGAQSMPLDWLGLGRVDFIKIDVEGFEVAVLNGARNTITRCKPNMLIEVYPEMLERQRYSRGDLEAALTELGYKWRPVIGNESEPRWDILAEPT